jgi:DNA-binding winged helix-turn-helix (wHTH) protein
MPEVSQSASPLIRFGPFEADLRTQELRKHGVRLHLPGQSFQILKMLLERPHDLVTRDELRRALWPSDTFVDFDHNLNAAVKRLRAALGDSADEPSLIETLPRRGYRFIGTLNRTRAGQRSILDSRCNQLRYWTGPRRQTCLANLCFSYEEIILVAEDSPYFQSVAVIHSPGIFTFRFTATLATALAWL